ncbi:hypothetical protein L7F22_059251 [Adiantum nelumboides]|nr:hypothetical protein [Adiantum nelumboides]
MAMEVRGMVVLMSVGEKLLNSIQDLKDCEKIFAEPAQIQNGKMLMEFVKDFAPKHAKPFVGMQHGASFVWKPLSESLPTIRTVENQNQVAVFFKLSIPSGEHSGLQPVVFFSLPTSFQLPFKEREEVMQSVAHRINKYFEAVQSNSVTREDMLFIAFEGPAGVGKTRCLLEIIDQMIKYLPLQSSMRHLYTSGAVQGTYVTFNGSAISGRKSHGLPEFLVKMAEGSEAEYIGGLFMQAYIIQENLYGRPFVALPTDMQQEILAENVNVSMKKVTDHIRKSN